jgi:hypothetical protein
MPPPPSLPARSPERGDVRRIDFGAYETLIAETVVRRAIPSLWGGVRVGNFYLRWAPLQPSFPVPSPTGE